MSLDKPRSWFARPAHLDADDAGGARRAEEYREAVHAAGLALFRTRSFESSEVVALCAHPELPSADLRAWFAATFELLADGYAQIHRASGLTRLSAAGARPALLLDQFFAGIPIHVHAMLLDPRRMVLVAVDANWHGWDLQNRQRGIRLIFADLIEKMARTHVESETEADGLGPMTTMALTAVAHDLTLSWALTEEADRPTLDSLAAEAVQLMRAVSLAPLAQPPRP